MTAGSAAVSRDSPPAFNNILAYKDEVVPWLKDLADACHEHGAAVMIQLTHLGRRTRWDGRLAAGRLALAQARGRPSRLSRSRSRTGTSRASSSDYADAAERMKAAGLDGIELEAYGHLMDQFWSPLTNELDGALWRLARQPVALRASRCSPRSASASGRNSSSACAIAADEVLEGGLTRDGRPGDRATAARRAGMVDFLNVIRGHIDTDAGADRRHPDPGHGERAASRFRRRNSRRDANSRHFTPRAISDVATARHAIASGKLDMVGMTRAAYGRPAYRAQDLEGREDEIRPCVGANYCLDRIYQGGAAYCIHNRRHRARDDDAARDRPRRDPAQDRRGRRRAGRTGGGAGRGGARPRGRGVRGRRAGPAARSADRAEPAPARHDGHRRLAHRAMRVARRELPLQRLGGSGNRARRAARRRHRRDRRPSAYRGCSSAGDDLVVSSWDILAGDASPGANVLLFDDAGDAAALQAAEAIAETGARLEIMTPGPRPSRPR